MNTPDAIDPAPTLMTPQHLHLDNKLGAVFIGLIVASVLFGIANVQTFMYSQNSSRDPFYLRCIIGLLWILDALQLALIFHALYFYLITNFANPSIINVSPWSLCAHIIVTALSDIIIRLYFTRRVWIMSQGNWILAGVSGVLGGIAFTSGLGFGGKTFSYSSILEFAQISWVPFTSFGTGVAADVWVAIILCSYLASNRTGFKQTDTKINTLMTYVINTGLLTSVCATCTLVTFAVMPHNFISVAIYFSLPKLYFNSSLATLNARDKLREGFFGDSQHISRATEPARATSIQPNSFSTNKPTASFTFGEKIQSFHSVNV